MSDQPWFAGVAADDSPAANTAGAQYRTPLIARSAAAASGTCRAMFPQTPSDEFWFIRRLVISCSSSSLTYALVYDDDPNAGASAFIDSSGSGNKDVGEFIQPHQISPGKTLYVVWGNASDAAIGTARAFYDVRSA